MRKKKQITRRRRALRWLAVLAFMIAWAVIPGRFRFSPDQAIREAERLGNLGPTQLIAELPGEEGRTLRANDKGIMVSTLYEDVYEGWNTRHHSFLDCFGAEPLYAGFCFWNTVDDVSHTFWASWYGRINDPEAAAIRLDAYKGGILQDSHTILKEDWIELDGYTYFVLEFKWKSLHDGVLFSQLLDEEGNLLYSRELSIEETRLGYNYGALHQ